ncbi:MAG: hypothetical protein AAB229_05300 [Candidatus Hydrogenedentota bacterium]
MKKFTIYIVLAILCIASVSVQVIAAKMNEHRDMTKHMRDSAREPHHMLAMAYKSNLMTFARILQQPAGRSEAVDTTMARSAVMEMRRSFEMLKQHHSDHERTMSDDMKVRMSKMTQQMDTRIATIDSRLDELELEVSYSVLNARNISELSRKIVHECNHIASMHTPARTGVTGRANR